MYPAKFAERSVQWFPLDIKSSPCVEYHRQHDELHSITISGISKPLTRQARDGLTPNRDLDCSRWTWNYNQPMIRAGGNSISHLPGHKHLLDGNQCISQADGAR